MSKEISFEDVYDPSLLEKLYNNYDKFVVAGDFSKNIIDALFEGVTGNEHLNYHKILNNLGLSAEEIDWQPSFLVLHCITYHTINLYLNNPEKLTPNHKMMLGALDLYTCMHEDPNYPHKSVTEQLQELASTTKEGGMGEFYQGKGFDDIKQDYINTFNNFKAAK